MEPSLQEDSIDFSSFLIPRDVSWLHFNYRVLQEAKDPSVPLYERIKFLAIYSSNLDEFFRVRVASMRRLRKLEKDTRKALNVTPKKILEEVLDIVEEQQVEFGHVFREQVLPGLAYRGIFLVNNSQFSADHQQFAEKYFKDRIEPDLSFRHVKDEETEIFLENKALYFVLDWIKGMTFVKIPSKRCGRFVELPEHAGFFYVTFLDDILRHNLPRYFDDKPIKGIFSIKVSRDAELYIDEHSGDLIKKIKESLADRETGLPTRFLYDSDMPASTLKKVRKILNLSKFELIPGARYHNFNDFFAFPAPEGVEGLHDSPMPPLDHPELDDEPSIMQAVEQQDYMLHFPYQSFSYVLRYLKEAIEDESVTDIKITLYRVASDSLVGQHLIEALEKGKKVTVFIEAKARFDEESNLFWGEQLEKKGAKVLYSKPNIKVHTKLFLILKKQPDGTSKTLVYVGTGNFNEKTAKLYCDHALLTADQRIGNEVLKVFEMLEEGTRPEFEHLLVSPHVLRRKFIAFVDREIENAKAGKEAYMILKMNSLEDEKMITKLYEASMAGVKVQLIVRGICCMMPGVAAVSENIQSRSIVDRFLEHARVYIFANAGEEQMFIASADWMTRNLDHRIELGAPIYDQRIYQQLRHIIDLQLRDNTKARCLDPGTLNDYFPKGENEYRAQTDTYNYLKTLVL